MHFTASALLLVALLPRTTDALQPVSLHVCAQAALAPRASVVAVLTGSETSARRGPRTATGRRTEFDGSPAGEGGAAGALRRQVLARKLKPLPPPARSLVQSSGKYDPDDVEIKALWAALLAAYGDEALALEAVGRQRTILSPRYMWPPPLIARSRDALVEVLGSEAAAIQVMRENPSVLQCGRSLVDQPAAQIRAFASFRRLVDATPESVSKALLPLVVVAALCAVPSSSGAERDPAVLAVLSVLKPVLGTVGAGLFGATLLFAAKASEKPSALKGRGEQVTLPWEREAKSES